MELVNATFLRALGCFLVLEGNHTILNSKFSNFFGLKWFYQISNIPYMKWVNSEFSGGAVQMMIFNERYDVRVTVALIDNCRFSHIYAYEEFMFKWVTTTVFYLNSHLENLTMQINARAWFKGEEGNLYIDNSTFLNCGFDGETSNLIKAFDKSLFNVWWGVFIEVKNSNFFIDDSCSMRGGFINVFNALFSFLLYNSTFKVTKSNPEYSYKGVIVLSVPVNKIYNSSFLNLRCATWQPNIEHENGAGVLVLGTLSYIPIPTAIKVEFFFILTKVFLCFKETLLSFL